MLVNIFKMSFRDRLLLVISELGMNRNSFSEKLGYKKNSYIYEYTREKPEPKEPGFDFFQRLVLAKTGINIEWLLTGEGDRFIKKGTVDTNFDEAAIRKELQYLRDEAKFLRGRNTELTQAVLNLSGSKVIEQG